MAFPVSPSKACSIESASACILKYMICAYNCVLVFTHEQVASHKQLLEVEMVPLRSDVLTGKGLSANDSAAVAALLSFRCT
jgi:hypothetical protein